MHVLPNRHGDRHCRTYQKNVSTIWTKANGKPQRRNCCKYTAVNTIYGLF